MAVELLEHKTELNMTYICFDQTNDNLCSTPHGSGLGGWDLALHRNRWEQSLKPALHLPFLSSAGPGVISWCFSVCSSLALRLFAARLVSRNERPWCLWPAEYSDWIEGHSPRSAKKWLEVIHAIKCAICQMNYIHFHWRWIRYSYFNFEVFSTTKFAPTNS